ncbi:hypothetical protein ACO0M4_22195 [Streptomyces sp. RGM 3693]
MSNGGTTRDTLTPPSSVTDTALGGASIPTSLNAASSFVPSSAHAE